MMRRFSAIGAALLVLAACAPSTSTRSGGSPTPTPTPSGTGKYDSGGASGAFPIQPGENPPKPSTTCPNDVFSGLAYGVGERVTADWKISWVLRCTSTQKSYPGNGVWNVVTTERADGSPDALLRALQKPDAPSRSGIACPAIAMLIPWFVLVDTSGKPHFAKLPVTECGLPQTEAIDALNALPFHVVKTVRTTQVQSQLSLDTGCSDQWKDIIAITAPGPGTPPMLKRPTVSMTVPAPDETVLPGKPEPAPATSQPASDSVLQVPPVATPMPNASVGSASAGGGSASAGTVTAEPGTVTPPSPPKPHVCVYKSDNDAGKLVRGRTLSEAELVIVLRGLTGAVHPCGIRHTQFAVITGDERGDWYVELDGCTRSMSPSGAFAQTSDAALAVLKR